MNVQWQGCFSDLFSLFFPLCCPGCSAPLQKGEKLICIFCLNDLPHSVILHPVANPVASQFRGRADLDCVYSAFRFEKGGRLQQMLHHLKYKSRQDIGVMFGRILGGRLPFLPGYTAYDGVVPVPLHSKRERERGYNQAECVARGLAAVLNIPVITGNLVRSRATTTQTSKSRFERCENVRDVFVILDPVNLEGKHLLLVDDVITTGATLESCLLQLAAVKGTRIGIASVAYA